MKDKQQVSSYIRRKFGADSKDQFLLHVRQTTRLLKQHLNMGVIDPLFEDCSIAYRSVIIDGLSKIVYYIDSDMVIYIVAFWDCRREPKVLSGEVR